MTHGGRIREIRKSLNMTMDQFGSKIGVTKSTISNIENDNRFPTEHMLKSIIREFNVNEEWLRNGTGEMFEELLPEDEYGRAAAEISKGDPLIRDILISYWKQPEDRKQAIRDFIIGISEETRKEKE